MYKVLAAIISVLISNAAFALDSEYKNTLTKIDLNKSSESSYNINLYTAKEYSEPVKVVKKSDLNYYILLPETKNTLQNMQISSSDIRSIETKIYPYAGADVKNGYTKININTTKPINFNVSTRTLSAMSPQNTLSKETEKQEIKTAALETKVQKKNLVQKTESSKNDSLTAQKTNANSKKSDKKEVKPVIKQVPAAAKVSSNKVETKKQETKKVEIKKQEVKKTDELKQEIKNEEPVKKVQKQPEEIIKQEPVEKEQILQKENKQLKEEINKIVEKPKQSIKKIKTFKRDIKPKSKIKHKNNFSIRKNIVLLKNKVQNKLLEYGLNIRELLLMIAAGILSFITMLLILTKSKEIDTRLRSKADFIEKNFNKNSTLVPKKSKENKKTNKYFVFDKNVKQTGFIPPASNEKRNYELSSYEPSLQAKTTATIEPYQAKQVKSEYDIIQNILREDAFIELSQDEVETANKQTDSLLQTPKKEVSEPIKPISVPIGEQKKEKDEPEILSNVEIAPQRGFMCVSYNNSVNLIGYIFDDVFALYNFQRQKLENYNIKFRISEKTSNGANFIVKVDKTKMIVSVTKSSMNLEIAY